MRINISPEALKIIQDAVRSSCKKKSKAELIEMIIMLTLVGILRDKP